MSVKQGDAEATVTFYVLTKMLPEVS